MPNEAVLDTLIRAAMFGVMFSMGLTLTSADFQRIVQTPRATLLGTLLQLLVMPLVAIGLAAFFGLSPVLTAGLVIIGACPGGMFSNMYVHLARGHTALSVTLTATSTVISLFTLPIWLEVGLAAAPGGTETLELPILETALGLASLTVLPVAIGMIVRARRPDLLRWERRIAFASAAVVVIGAIAQGADRPELPVQQIEDSLAPVFAFAAAALGIGVAAPALSRLSARDTVTIAVELIVKNTLLGIVVAGQALEFDALIPVFLFATLQTPAGLLLLVGWRWLAKRGLLRDEPALRASASR